MKNCILIFLLLLVNCLYSQNTDKQIINCDESYFVMYGDTIVDENLPDNYHIYFEEGFNDSLKVFLNNQVIGEGYYKTDPSIGTTATKIAYSISDSLRLNVLLIKNLTTNRCLECVIDTRYKLMYINYGAKNWVIFYSNRFTIYE